MLNGLFVRDSKLDRVLEVVLEGELDRGAARKGPILEHPVQGRC